MSNLSRSLKLFLAIFLIALTTTTSTAQTLAPLPNSSPEWVQDFAPFRIVGNLYYVGSYDLACYLITTPKGHILINTGIPGSDTMILRHVRALGFKVTDIHILLTNQAHFDHVGGMSAVRQATKAKMFVDAADAPILADGGNSDFIFGGKGPLFVPLNADRLLHDHDTVKLGDVAIVVLHHPGHTKGSSSFLFAVKDETRTYRVLIANIPTILDATRFPSMPAYPNVMKDYAYTLDTMPKITFDLWFAAHASQFNLHKKYQPGDPYHPAAFSDRAGYDAAIRDAQDVFAKRASAASH